jgi:hypothetical protein
MPTSPEELKQEEAYDADPDAGWAATPPDDDAEPGNETPLAQPKVSGTVKVDF